MRIGFITLGKNVPSTRFRFLPYIDLLKDRGHQCVNWMSRPSVYEHYPWLGWRISHMLKRTVRQRQLSESRNWQPDCIYLERGVLNDDSLDLDQAFRKTTPRLVLDIDDGIFLEQPDKIDRLIEMSDHCIVSNEPIAEYVRSRHDKVTLIPTVVELARFKSKPVPAAAKEFPVIGWIGTTPTMEFLSVCAEPLRELAKLVDFELLVVGPTQEPLQRINLDGVRLRFERWKATEEVHRLHEMDVGIMPLPEGKEWMKYKAATKLVQYLSVGIPAVATPIGVNAHILEGNKVGFAASNATEWLDAFKTLLADHDLRSRLGSAGRQLVEERYSIEANIDVLENVLTGGT